MAGHSVRSSASVRTTSFASGTECPASGMMTGPDGGPDWYSGLVQSRLVQKTGGGRLTEKLISYRVKTIRRGDREAEGAALEMPCTVTRTVGSNPTLSALYLRLALTFGRGVNWEESHPMARSTVPRLCQAARRVGNHKLPQSPPRHLPEKRS